MLLSLADVEALDFPVRSELEAEVGAEIAPLVAVELAGQVEAVIVDTARSGWSACRYSWSFPERGACVTCAL